MSGGYMGRILRADLGSHLLSVERLPEPEVLRGLVGGTGPGLYYLRQSPLEGGSPTGAELPLVLMTGPLTGTLAPSSSDYTVLCYSLEAPTAAAVAHSHGFWGPYLKSAGFDGIVVQGRGNGPVYLVVDNGRIEIRGADHLWGLDTRETERLIKSELGGDPEKTSVACIGPGGEAMLPGGMIKNDRNHGAGRGSPGAVMGAKNLKAIAVRGSKTVPIANPIAFQAAVARWEKEMGEGRRPAGSGKARAVDYSRSCSGWRVTPRPSYNCRIECAYDVDITEGPFAGFTTSIKGGADNLEGAAEMVGIRDSGEALALGDFYDAMGLDSRVVGGVIAAAFESYEEGRITEEETGGLVLTLGNYAAVMELVRQVRVGGGFGRVLASQLSQTARNDAEGVGRVAEPREPEVSRDRQRRMWNDCTGACWFAEVSVETVSRAVGAAVGWDDFGGDEALQVGARVIAALRSTLPEKGTTVISDTKASPSSSAAPSA